MLAVVEDEQQLALGEAPGELVDEREVGLLLQPHRARHRRRDPRRLPHHGEIDERDAVGEGRRYLSGGGDGETLAVEVQVAEAQQQ